MYINNNTLSECRLMSDLNISSLQLKDAKYIQSATNNNEMNLLPSSVINNNIAIIKMNACMKNAFSQGSVSLAGSTRTVAGAGANYCGSVEPLPMPELLYDFRESTTTVANGWANQGSGGGSLTTNVVITLNDSTLGIGELGRARLSSASYSSCTFINPLTSVGTSDFTFVIERDYTGVGETSAADNGLSLGDAVLKLWYASNNINLVVGGTLVHTASLSQGVHCLKLGRESGTLRFIIDGVQSYSQALGSITFSNNITFQNQCSSSSVVHQMYVMALWSSYISDPNPIAGLNRREIVVTKTA